VLSQSVVSDELVPSAGQIDEWTTQPSDPPIYDNAVYRPQSGIYTALGIGLALIALIIYAAIFAYR
jgi:hypothetical protein